MTIRVFFAVALLFLLTLSSSALTIFGTNGHDNWTTAAYSQEKEDLIFQTLHKSNLLTYRVDVHADPHSIATLNRLVALGRQYNVVIRPMLYVENLNPQDAYQLIKRFAHDISIWEFGNELNLHGPELFDDAIREMAVARAALVMAAHDTGVTLKSAINVAAFAGLSGKGLDPQRAHYDFLERAVSRHLDFDFITFHYYPSRNDRYSGWIATYLAPLRAYGKPVILNETNCAEIYKGDDGNSEVCAETLKTLFDEVMSNYSDLVVEMDTYELLDDPAIKGVEGHFGMMYDLDHPKRLLQLIADYAKLAKDGAVPR